MRDQYAMPQRSLTTAAQIGPEHSPRARETARETSDEGGLDTVDVVYSCKMRRREPPSVERRSACAGTALFVGRSGFDPPRTKLHSA